MLNRIAKFSLSVASHVIVFVVFFLLLGGVAVLASKSVTATSELNWVAGVTLAMAWLVGVAVVSFLMWKVMQPSAPTWLRKYIGIGRKAEERTGLAEQYPAAVQLALMCVVILTAVLVLSAMSAVLAEQGLATYVVERSKDKPMTELLFRFYLWHAADMIPLLDLSKVYGLEPPIRAENFLAQSIVLVFRTAILSFAIAAIISWIKANRSARQIVANSEATEA